MRHLCKMPHATSRVPRQPQHAVPLIVATHSRQRHRRRHVRSRGEQQHCAIFARVVRRRGRQPHELPRHEEFSKHMMTCRMISMKAAVSTPREERDAACAAAAYYTCADAPMPRKDASNDPHSVTNGTKIVVIKRDKDIAKILRMTKKRQMNSNRAAAGTDEGRQHLPMRRAAYAALHASHQQ